MPVLEVKARRVGGATYQVPMEIRPERRQYSRSEMANSIQQKTWRKRLWKIVWQLNS